MGAIEDINNLTPKGKALLHKVTEPSQPTIREQVAQAVAGIEPIGTIDELRATQILTLITQHLLEELKGLDVWVDASRNEWVSPAQIRAFVEGMLRG